MRLKRDDKRADRGMEKDMDFAAINQKGAER